MKKFFTAILLLLVTTPMISFAQTEEEQVKTLINKFFEGMKRGDSALVRSTFISDPVLMTTFTRKGEPHFEKEDLSNLLNAVARPLKPGEVYDERLLSWEIRIDERLATAWTPYAFFIGDKFSHCGVNSFQLYKSPDGWKIVSIFDTRRRDACPN